MLQSKVIAREADAPMKFLESILLELKRNEVVESKRGIFGGYYLRMSPEQIKLGDIIRYMDGTLAPIRCASISAYEKCDDCLDENTCAIRHAMIEVRDAVAGVLDNKTLAEMVGGHVKSIKK